MNCQFAPIQTCLVLTIAGFFATTAISQNEIIGLEEALQLARSHHAGLERDRLSVQQWNKMVDAGKLSEPTQLFFSGEEFDFSDQSGVQSLNLQQNFHLPKAVRNHRAYYRQKASLAEKQLALTDQEIKRQVRHAYYRLLFAKQEQVLISENLDFYNNFLTVANTHLESGETGKIPQLAVRSRLGRAVVEQQHVNEKYVIALSLFNQWLGVDSLYDVDGSLPLIQFEGDTSLKDSPHLEIFEARRDLAVADLELKKSQLIPQLNSGFKLQTAFGTFPLFGYQIGINVPLFQKSHKGHIDASRVGIQVEEAAILAERQQLKRTISELQYRLDHQFHVIEYLQMELHPLVSEQSEVFLEAYREGEVSYLEYLTSLEQVMEVKQRYLEALYQYNTLQVELDYRLGY